MRRPNSPSRTMDPMATAVPAYGEQPEWGLGRPKFRPLRVLLAWAISALALLGAAWLVPGASINDYRGALPPAAPVARPHPTPAPPPGALGATLPPLVAAVRLPFVALLGFLVVLVLDAAMLLATDHITGGDLSVD